MRKFGLITAAVAVVGLFAGNAMAQSAKFAATWSDDLVEIDTGVVTSGSVTKTVAETDLATIHVASQKDLLIGVSGQIGIYTMTEARSAKSGNESKATAEGEVLLTVRLAPEGSNIGLVCDGTIGESAAPGPIVFAARFQELTVQADADSDVRVRLVLDTTAAHHFNFLGIDLPQGYYGVYACFDLSAMAAVVGDDAMAQAKVGLGPRVLSVQEVRAVKDGIVEDMN